MKLTTHYTRIAGDKELTDLVVYHESKDNITSYRESKIPMFLLLMTNRAYSYGKMQFFSPEAQYEFVSTINPEAQYEFTSPDEPEGKVPMHQHNGFEFTIILRGSMYQIVEGKRYYYPAGSCCLMNRNTLHNEELSTDFQCIFVFLSTKFVEQLMGNYENLLFPEDRKIMQNMVFRFMEENLDENHNNTKEFLDFIPKTNQEDQIRPVQQIFEEMKRVMIEKKPGSSYRTLELLLRLFGILSDPDCYNAVHITSHTSMESLLFSRIDHILSKRHGRITHTELAQILNYNGSYIGRIVKKCTGKSLFDYSMKYTMAYAAECLLTTSKSITDIASELDFTNRSHFYKLFRESFGMTPKDYRKQSNLKQGAEAHEKRQSKESEMG